MKTTTLWHDPIVEEVRKHGEEYAASFDYDLDRMVLDLRRRQEERGRKVISFSDEGSPARPSKRRGTAE